MSYRQISNTISAASDTANVEELQQIADVIDTACITGKISVVDAAALKGELDEALDYHYRHQADYVGGGGYSPDQDA